MTLRGGQLIIHKLHVRKYVFLNPYAKRIGGKWVTTSGGKLFLRTRGKTTRMFTRWPKNRAACKHTQDQNPQVCVDHRYKTLNQSVFNDKSTAGGAAAWRNPTESLWSAERKTSSSSSTFCHVKHRLKPRRKMFLFLSCFFRKNVHLCYVLPPPHGSAPAGSASEVECQEPPVCTQSPFCTRVRHWQTGFCLAFNALHQKRQSIFQLGF